MVRVVSVRGLNAADQRAGIVYVGRRCAGWPGHPLANPYKLAPGGDRDAVLAKYRAWLLNRATAGADLAALWEQTGRGVRPLGCWCGSWEPGGERLQCHAVLLAELLNERFAGKEMGS